MRLTCHDRCFTLIHSRKRTITMILLRLLASALLVLTPLATTPAMAAAFDITIAGTFNGSLDGRDFTGRSLIFTGVTDSDDTDEVFDEIHHPFVSLTVRLDDIDYAVTDAAIFFVAPLSGLAGIVDPDASRGLIRFDYTNENIVIVDDLTLSFATSGGALRVGTGSSVSVAGITLPNINTAVPEPAGWVMMMLGFVLTGFAVRKRGVLRPTPLLTA